MEYKDCMEFANANRTAYVATTEGNQPHVRALGMWYADEHGFYFQVQTVKAVYKQLMANPKVELAFYAPGEGVGRVMRVTGEVEFVHDRAIKQRVLNERKFLQGMGIDRPDHPLLAVFRVAKGEAFFWTMADSMKEAAIPRIKFDLK